MSEAQERISAAGFNYEDTARQMLPSQEGYALLAILDVVRQIGIEMFEPVEEVTLEVGVSGAETLYSGAAPELPVTRHVTVREHYCPVSRRVEDGTKQECGCAGDD